jgi:hypothetical protein
MIVAINDQLRKLFKPATTSPVLAKAKEKKNHLNAQQSKACK